MTATFSGLPNELILHIWSHVLQPNDVESFALASRNVYALAEPFIEEHRRLKNKFTFLDHQTELDGSPLAEFLSDILLNPRAALYVKVIGIENWKGGWDDPHMIASNDSGKYHVRYPEETMKLFEEAVKKSAFIPEAEAANWISEIHLGDETNVLALIISLLTNVRSFMFDSTHEKGTRLSEMIRRIGKSSSASALSRLTEVYIGYYDTESIDIDFDWVNTFSVLKSVRSIKGYGVGQLHGEPNYWLSLPPNFSNIISLDLYCCDIDKTRLSSFLQSVRALESFSYTAAASEDSDFDPFWICTSLAPAAHSLQSLHILSSDGMGGHMGSLAGFDVLTDLHTGYGMLLDYATEFDDDKLIQMLPSSIERVYLEHNDRYDLLLLQDQISGMCKLGKERLPNLKALIYEINNLDVGSSESEQKTGEHLKDSKIISTLKQMSTEVGVELTISQSPQDQQ